MNVVTISGRLGRDPELKTSQGGTQYLKVGIAVDNYNTTKRERDSFWVDLTAFGKSAELIANHFGKGDPLFVTGKIDVGTYERDGETKKTFGVIVNKVHFESTGKPSRDSGSRGNYQERGAPSNNSNNNNGYQSQRPAQSPNLTDDIPF